MTQVLANLLPKVPNIQTEVLGFAGRLVQFTRLLRDNGYQLDMRAGSDAVKVLSERDILNWHKFKTYLQALFCRSATEIDRFDEIFNAYWRGHVGQKRTVVSNTTKAAGCIVSKNKKQQDGVESCPGLAQYFEWRQSQDANDDSLSNVDSNLGNTARLGGASTAPNMASIDFGNVSDMDEAERLLHFTEKLARRMRYRLSRRRCKSVKGTVIDLRRALRKAVSTGGLPIVLPKKRRSKPPVNLVLFVDVSGSMDAYSLFFARFMQTLMQTFITAQAFLFHTRLVHVSDVFREGKADVMMDKLCLMSQGWSGGTRMGTALAGFNLNYARKYLNAKSVVIIMSDGFDTDEPKLLESELKRLKGGSHKIVWLNPFGARQGYAPDAQGPQVLERYSDLMLPCHNLRSLLEIEEVLANV